jgi:hypothetical protein
MRAWKVLQGLEKPPSQLSLTLQLLETVLAPSPWTKAH